MELDRSLVGREFDRVVYDPVTEEEILEYAAAYGEENPLYTDPAAAAAGPYGGLVAPPTFPVRLPRRHFMPPDLRLPGRAGFDAGKDLELGAPIRPGDVLTAATTVHDVYEKTGRSGRMWFIVLRTVVTNQAGERVATIDQRFMFR